MPERVIPGVNVTVVKDVVVPQLSPAGVLGLVGLVEDASQGVQRAASWRRFVQVYGLGSANSMPEARAALENGVTELVVVPVESGTAKPATGEITLSSTESGAGLLALVGRAAGTWANRVTVTVTHRARKSDGAVIAFDLEILRPGQRSGEGEGFTNLQLLPGFSRSVADVLNAQCSALRLDAASSVQIEGEETRGIAHLEKDGVQVLLQTSEGAPALQVRATEAIELSLQEIPENSGLYTLTVNRVGETRKLLNKEFNLRSGPLLTFGPQDKETWQGCPDAAALFEALDALDVLEPELVLWPEAKPEEIGGGLDATAQDYINALDKLREEPDVDLVCAALQLPTPADDKDRKTIDANKRKVRQVYSAIISHSELMAAESKGRLGFGHVPPGTEPGAAVELADSLVSDRFVLASPHGTVGALAGRVGSLRYFQSPTMGALGGLTELEPRLKQEDQKALLQGRLVPIALERGRGTVVVKGITTDGEQLSVRRVADRAARGVQQIGHLFIGKLNNADTRAALRQKLGEFLYQMQRDGAIVPSTDGKLPAFTLEVYSTQDDFSKGIVRVDLAVRPVRAIDYIYATLLIQV